MSNQTLKIASLLFTILLSQNIINVTSTDYVFAFEVDTGNAGAYGMILFDGSGGEEYVSDGLTGFEEAATTVEFTISIQLSTVAQFYLVSTQDNTDLVKFSNIYVNGIAVDMNSCNYGYHCGLQDDDLTDDLCQVLNVIDADSSSPTAYVDENMADAEICHMTFTEFDDDEEDNYIPSSTLENDIKSTSIANKAYYFIEFEIDTANDGKFGLILFDDNYNVEEIPYALSGFDESSTIYGFQIFPSSTFSILSSFYLVSTQDNTDLIKFSNVWVDGNAAIMSNCNYGYQCGLIDDDLSDDMCQALQVIDASSSSPIAYVNENLVSQYDCHMTFTTNEEDGTNHIGLVPLHLCLLIIVSIFITI